MPPGVRALDHTADVGLDVSAPTREALFTRAAQGMQSLIQGGAPPEVRGAGVLPATVRSTTLLADDLPALLREWLRELLYWHETAGLSFGGARFRTLEDTRLEAEVTLVHAPGEPIREIKGVTLHGLLAERRGEKWIAQVIFDV